VCIQLDIVLIFFVLFTLLISLYFTFIKIHSDAQRQLTNEFSCYITKCIRIQNYLKLHILMIRMTNFHVQCYFTMLFAQLSIVYLHRQLIPQYNLHLRTLKMYSLYSAFWFHFISLSLKFTLTRKGNWPMNFLVT
jgi:hypothetical protein